MRAGASNFTRPGEAPAGDPTWVELWPHHDLAERGTGLDQRVGLAHVRQAEAGANSGLDGAPAEQVDYRAHQPAAPRIVVIVVWKEKQRTAGLFPTCARISASRSLSGNAVKAL